ncbi:MAG: prolyl oligopeptidase family serine peptidase [Lentisphaeria bacterium]|nr:prolyl oligopeptidase family serine peptidase [Lentisphaeria bacterium]
MLTAFTNTPHLIGQRPNGLPRLANYFFALFISLATISKSVSGAEPGMPGDFQKVPMTRRMYSNSKGYFQGNHKTTFKKLFEAGGSFWLNNNKTAESAIDYALSEQSLVIYAPDDYDGGPGWGAYLYTSPNATGRLPNNYKEIMRKHKLIYVAANGTQNGSGLLRRMALTLDALATARSMYTIDPQRVIISGLSGGGTVATTLGLMCPELFIGLVNHSSQYYLTNVPGNTHSEHFSYLNGYLKDSGVRKMTGDLAKFKCRWAFVTGDRDKNYQQMLGVADNWKSLGLDARLFNQPQMGHTLANPEYLDQMLTWIEERRDQDAVKELQALKKQRQMNLLLASCKRILSSAPAYQEQFKEATKLMEQFKELAEKKAQHLLQDTPDVKAMIHLDSQWPQLPSTPALKTKINESGEKYAEKILAEDPVSLKTLKQYLSYFGEYACAAPVKDEFNRKGEEMLKKMAENPPDTNKLISFVHYWHDMPCAESVKKDLGALGERELSALASEQPVLEKHIRHFITKWTGFPVAEKAMEELEKLADEKLNHIEEITREDVKKFQLEAFISQYKGTRAAKRALIEHRQIR